MLRAFVFIWYEQAHFDSDQAIVGLMAWHLAHLQAFPLYFYGQTYMLGVESWLAAPAVLVGGASVTALKMPLLALNMAIAAALVHLLIRDGGVRPAAAFIAALFFTAAPPVTASRLVEAQGGNIEPFGYVLAVWVLQRRPIWFGVTLGVGFLNREFALYGVCAIVVIGLWDRWLLSRRGLVHMATVLAAFAAVWFAVAGLTPLASNYFDGTRAPAAGSLSFAHAPGQLRMLASTNLPIIFGARAVPLQTFNIASETNAGHGWVAPVLVVALVLMVVRLLQARHTAPAAPSHFILYLTLIGLQAAAAFLVVPQGGDGMLIRYTLLVLFFAVGLVAAYACAERSRGFLAVALGCVLLWACASVFDHLKLLAEYQTRRPPGVHRQLADHLVENGIEFGRADYWTAYHVTFLTGERTIINPTDVVRIPAYRDRVAAHSDVAVDIGVGEPPCARGTRLERWYICRP